MFAIHELVTEMLDVIDGLLFMATREGYLSPVSLGNYDFYQLRQDVPLHHGLEALL
jgi:hypothetical protein